MTKILHIVVEEVVYKGLKNTDFGVRESQPGFEFQALLLTSHVVMANVVNLPEPQFSSL